MRKSIGKLGLLSMFGSLLGQSAPNQPSDAGDSTMEMRQHNYVPKAVTMPAADYKHKRTKERMARASRQQNRRIANGKAK